MMFAQALILATLALPIETGECSYYTVESCRREGTSGITASGISLIDEARIAASWHYRFGTELVVYSWTTNRWTVVRVLDRGPARRLVRQGRVLDISLRAAEDLRMTHRGVVGVWIWRVR